VLLIENGKFNQFTTPAGKLSKVDFTGDIEGTYIKGAIRECHEETGLNLQAVHAANALAVSMINRNDYGIPEGDHEHYDTRLYYIDLGVQELAKMQASLKKPTPENPDSKEAFWEPATHLLYSSIPADHITQSGRFTNHCLSRQPAYDTDKVITLTIRPTVMVTLNGIENNQPAPGIFTVIGNSATPAIDSFSNERGVNVKNLATSLTQALNPQTTVTSNTVVEPSPSIQM
jgi:hypothetical protein